MWEDIRLVRVLLSRQEIQQYDIPRDAKMDKRKPRKLHWQLSGFFISGDLFGLAI